MTRSFFVFQYETAAALFFSLYPTTPTCRPPVFYPFPIFELCLFSFGPTSGYFYSPATSPSNPLPSSSPSFCSSHAARLLWPPVFFAQDSRAVDTAMIVCISTVALYRERQGLRFFFIEALRPEGVLGDVGSGEDGGSSRSPVIDSWLASFSLFRVSRLSWREEPVGRSTPRFMSRPQWSVSPPLLAVLTRPSVTCARTVLAFSCPDCLTHAPLPPVRSTAHVKNETLNLILFSVSYLKILTRFQDSVTRRLRSPSYPLLVNYFFPGASLLTLPYFIQSPNWRRPIHFFYSRSLSVFPSPTDIGLPGFPWRPPGLMRHSAKTSRSFIVSSPQPPPLFLPTDYP